MHDIKTMVLFDLEATGLRNSGRPRITELSLVAVNLQDVLGRDFKNRSINSYLHSTYTISELHTSINKFKIETSELTDKVKVRLRMEALQPRVLNKLSLCFYPMTTILPHVTALTGLDNYNLSGQPQFSDDTVRLLEAWLSRLPGPVCLVAHNGDNYDYPLLLAEVKRTGEDLGPEILCADTWVGIREILQQRELDNSELVMNEEIMSLNKLIEAGAFEDEFSPSDLEAVITSESEDKKRKVENSPTEDIFKKAKILEKENETTPTRKKRIDSRESKVPLLNNKKNKSQSSASQPSVSDYFKSKRRQLFPGHSPASHKLVDLHTSLLGLPPSVSHGAEADCLTLLRIIGALGPEWVTWASKNARKLCSITPMWGNKK